ncbi:MAG: DUF1127 domain-containing protein [Gammaproteobacteria bacterium]|jgi:uncharacterized protein YjiS (DUF1127 family)|nr:DUF1127 domain-containing protein [Gammaproteobacteria bacterium]MBT3723592.1 DUF1127 domain-containing protein [Gammaproteobacteria bacterium]MBT4078640.1 DUF1127 domain-containing protein [Gammaproteobacteria bacterium]MBT4194017.1 DUF1127 domain-containing protein [Gammaproteobacteria bacterium]MBT4449980.1 DUF1127 domain-containing protein [Gammaproteobacteria bacterium]
MSTLILQQKWDGLSFKQVLSSAATTIQLWMDRQHQRKQLAKLEASQLVDMGLNVNQVSQEIKKPFWK